MFSKTTCPFCDKSKKTLTNAKISYTAVELDEIQNGAEVQAALKDFSGQRTVPNIFADRQHIGGNSDLDKKIANGDLKKLLNASWIPNSL